jgi:pimeloyl-ACP methyl ester carboxylesterase
MSQSHDNLAAAHRTTDGAPNPLAVEIHRAEVRGIETAFVREGAGGFPLLLVHGWPETMRIWWRNIRPLARAGFEVIVPDLRGFGQTASRPMASTTWRPAPATSTHW